MTQLTHWKKLENPDYIGAYAFQPGEKKVVTIASVSREMITGTEGKKSEETVVRFRENEKPMILNVTNAKQISKHAGSPFIEQWQGVRIILGRGSRARSEGESTTAGTGHSAMRRLRRRDKTRRRRKREKHSRRRFEEVWSCALHGMRVEAC